jgi:Zn-dependent M16 (insulinase) family peptidase
MRRQACNSICAVRSRAKVVLLKDVSRHLAGRKVQRYATMTEAGSLPQPGEHIHGFTVSKRKHVPELHLTALLFSHDKTGAEYLHVAREDTNNVFAINFKTNPIDETGLPHILEHITLCGSEKYPVRDPFFKMMPRSLANFMNAFTSSDYTSYPFATTNKQDFRNLSSVYLDATLHPLLKHTDFLQEGWRLGQENPTETATRENVHFKGVVYNEMKGQMSDGSYLYYIRFRDHMFPSLHNSGGDPEKMTNLTYDQLVAFSRKNYHPSNSKIFSYGDMDVSDQLAFVDAHLSGFSRAEAIQEIKEPRDLTDGPVYVVSSGPFDTMQSPDRQTKTSVSWLGAQTSDIVETFSISILSSLLMDGYGSPLYQGLVESGLGSSFSANTGYDSSAGVGIFSIGLDGMKADDVSAFRETLQDILRNKTGEAFLPHKVEGYMHQLEIALKHKTAGFGMRMLNQTLPGWMNGVDPMDALSWNEVVAEFRSRLKQERYLEGLVEKYLLNNQCLQFTMNPSESYSADLEQQEARRKERILSELEAQAGAPEAVVQKLGQQELDLLKEQETAPFLNLETLPSLHINDIARQKERKPRRYDSIGDVKCMWREADTNSITYFQAKHDFKNLPSELRLLLPLFTESLMRLGSKTKSVGDLEAEIMLKTGGISISAFVQPSPWDLDSVDEGLVIGGYALDRNVEAMLDLIHTLILDVDFTSPKATAAVQELLESKTSGALDSVAGSGHHFAVTSAASALSPRSALQDQLSGLTQLEYTASLLRTARSDPESLHKVIDKLMLLQRSAISNSKDLSFRVVCEASSVANNHNLLEKFLGKVPYTEPPTFPKSSDVVPGSSLSRRVFFDLPFQVSYTGSCLRTAPYTSPEKAPLTVLGHLLFNSYMHPEIREKGGAYGASASASPLSELFTMTSYRDPNPRNTLKIFENAGNFASDRDWSTRELEESKLGVFQQIDAPTSVKSDASKEFMLGITEDMDQQMRERLLDVTKHDVQSVAQKYLVDVPEDRKSVCILGEKKEWVGKDPESWQMKYIKMAA